MPLGRGKRRRVVATEPEAGAGSSTAGERPLQTTTVGNETLELILKKINEFEGKLKELTSINKDTQTSSESDSTRAIMEVDRDSSVAQGPAGSASTTSILAPSETRNLYVVQPSVTKPSFDGKPFTNPITFLKRLKKYIRAVNGSDRELDIALSCITGHARKVMDLYSKGWITFADFEKDFRSTYWTEQIQESVRYKLIHSVYSKDSGMTMSEHFAEQAESMQSLTIAFSERDLVNSIMRHFAIDIQRLWFTRTDEVSIASGANFLRSLEQNIIEKPMGAPFGTDGRHNRGSRYNRSGSVRPIAATMSANTWQGRGGAIRGRGYRRGRLGYGTNFNRASTPRIEQTRASTRPAIAFVKEGEDSSISKPVGENQTKN